ncbi:group-specific protein [Bacillus cereus]
MISVQVDEKEVRSLYLAEIAEKVKEIDAELVYWDANELKEELVWDGIPFKKHSFDPRFPKHKVGGKWYFPAQQVKEFLVQWISEQ